MKRRTWAYSETEDTILHSVVCNCCGKTDLSVPVLELQGARQKDSLSFAAGLLRLWKDRNWIGHGLIVWAFCCLIIPFVIKMVLTSVYISKFRQGVLIVGKGEIQEIPCSHIFRLLLRRRQCPNLFGPAIVILTYLVYNSTTDRHRKSNATLYRLSLRLKK